MRILRTVELHDEEALIELALIASTGVLTLPRTPQRIKQKLKESLESFSAFEKPYGPGKYLFVLENLETHQIEGCSAIHYDVASPENGYYYRIKEEYRGRQPINEIYESQILLVPGKMPIEDTSEICTLFLSPNLHQKGMGRLLSLGRFLFISSYPERFKRKILAELRGVIDPSGISIFWEAVGRHFCNITFEECVKLFEDHTLRSKDVVASFPIYRSLLPKPAQEVIGFSHRQSMPAFKILQKEGFELLDGVDILDGGPKLYAQVNEIRTVRAAKEAVIKEIIATSVEESLRPYLICNQKINFRACYGEVQDCAGNCVIDRDSALALKVDIGDKVRFITAKPSS